jgi:hypothetical protein
MGSSSPGRTGNLSSHTDNRQLGANPSRLIRASRGRTLSNLVSTRHRSSPTASPAKDRTGNNRRNGLRNHRP